MTESPDERLGLPSASNWRRYELCAGSWALEGEARRLGQLAHQDSPAAQRGTRIHAWLAGELWDGEPVKLDLEEQKTADFLQERAQFEVTRIFGDQPWQQVSEKRLWLTVGGKKVASGRFDRVVYNDKLALIQDFKTGFSPVDDIDLNAQLRFLAVVCALHLPNTVEEIICQLVTGPFGIFEKRFTRAELALAWENVTATVRKINDSRAPLNPSPEACRFCPAKLICPALQDKRVGIARMELIALPDGPQASMILDDVAMIRSRCDEIVEYYEAKMLADPNYIVPGYAMLPGPQRREVSNWKAARVRLEEFVGAEELEQLANYSIPSVEKLVAKALKLKGKEAGLKLAEILGDLLTVRQGNLCLKRVSGKPKLVTIELP